MTTFLWIIAIWIGINITVAVGRSYATRDRK